MPCKVSIDKRVSINGHDIVGKWASNTDLIHRVHLGHPWPHMPRLYGGQHSA